jgi:peptidoglycan/xylan/chitin deacetylase (PgdA/CDA1 family)
VAHAQENPQKKENFSRTEETQAIHKHRLKKLIEQLSSPKVEEKVSCKYESDIALAPPHKIVLLSFDDGPDPEHTQYILDTLEKHDVPGTFFMIAEKMQIHADLVSKVSASKYATIGNHSWSHPNFHEISSENQSSEIEKSDAIVSKIVTEKFFRYPYGNATCESNQQIRSRDYKIVGWHVDSCDWAFDHKGVVDLKEALSCGVLPQNRENFMAHVLDTVKERHGGIILMHEIHGNTIRQLDQLIIKLKEEGYTFGKITDKEFAPYLH